MSEEITHQFPNNGFEKMLVRLDSIDIHLGSIDTHMDSISTRMDSLETRMDSLEGRFLSLDEKVDRRLMETLRHGKR